MRFVILLIHLLFIPIVSNGQFMPDVSMACGEAWVLKNAMKLEKGRDNKEKNTKVTSEKLGDTLVIYVRGSESFVMKFTFNGEGKECDFEQVDFSCIPCAATYIEDELHYKLFKWRKVSEGKYLAKYSAARGIELTIGQNQFGCGARMVFRASKMGKKEYKELYKLAGSGW